MRSLKNDPTDKSAIDVLEGSQSWMRLMFQELSPARRVKAEEFIEHLILKGSSLATIKRYLQAIRTLGNDGKPYEELGQENLIEWIHCLPTARNDGRKERYDQATVELLKRLGKSFLRWVHNGGNGETPKVLECIHYKQPKMDMRKDILSEEEVRRLVDAAERQRDRAIVFVGYESGARAGEILSLRLRDVKLDHYGAVLLVKGKTGTRRIRLVQSVPDMQMWLNMHPLKGNPDAPLWVSRQGEGKQITKVRFQEILATCTKRAGIGKHVYPHLLRHTRATHLANVLTEAQMREFFGWTKRSEVPAIYVHLSGRDVDATLLRHYGIAVEVERKIESLKPMKCPRCMGESPVGATFCVKCGMALSREALVAHKEPSEIADELVVLLVRELIKNDPEKLEKILGNPEVKKRLSQVT